MQILPLVSELNEDHYSRKAIELLYDHKTHLANAGNVTIRDIEPQEADKYNGDFYGLLNSIGMDTSHHNPVLIVNNIKNSEDYRSNMLRILIPDRSEIDRLLNVLVYEVK